MVSGARGEGVNVAAVAAVVAAGVSAVGAAVVASCGGVKAQRRGRERAAPMEKR
jgi:hypothetical protein